MSRIVSLLILLVLTISLSATRAMAALDDVEEVIFATRQSGDDGHWYANFGHYAFSENDKIYRAGGCVDWT